MNMLLWVAAVTAIAGVGGTGIGGLISACFRKDSDRIVSLLLSFASGVMLSVVCMDLIPESVREGGSSGLWLTMAGILIGFAVIFLLNHIIDKKTNHEIPHIDPEHPKTADGLDELIHFDHYEEHRKSRRNLFVAGVVMACAIALHNLPEGMVIGAAYAAQPAADAFTGSGFVMAIIIGLHNIPEGMSVAVPLISGGMRRWIAILITALSGAPTILGALLGYGFGVMGPAALCLSLSFASGAMLYVVFGELLPEAILMWRSKLPAFATVIGMLAGLLIIFGG